MEFSVYEKLNTHYKWADNKDDWKPVWVNGRKGEGRKFKFIEEWFDTRDLNKGDSKEFFILWQAENNDSYDYWGYDSEKRWQC